MTLDEERALSRARDADAALWNNEVWGALHGVPFTLKDMHLTEGVRTVAGLAALKDNVPTEDGVAAKLLKSAGGILLGKSNMAINVEADNEVFGRPLNPYAPDGHKPTLNRIPCTGLVFTPGLQLRVDRWLGVSGHRPSLYCRDLHWVPGSDRSDCAGRWIALGCPNRGPRFSDEQMFGVGRAIAELVGPLRMPRLDALL